MPGSTEYSVAPVDLSGGSKTVVINPTLVDNPITTARLGDAYTNLPEVYKTQDFNEQDYRDKLLTTKYGTEASRRDKRKFKRYMQSEEGLAELDRARQAHKQAENQKWSQSLKARYQAMDQESARRREAMRAEWAAADAARAADLAAAVAQDDIHNSEVEAPAPKHELAPRTDWNARAQQYGFKSMDEVKQWQAQNGLVADGKFGNQSLAKWNELQGAQAAAPAPAPAPAQIYTNGNTQTSSKVVTTKPTFDFSGFGKKYNLNTETINGKKYLRYDPSGVGDFYIGEDGKVYLADFFGALGIPVTTYKGIPTSSETLKQNAKTLFTMLDDFNSGKTKAYDQWYAAYVAEHPKPAFNASLAGSSHNAQAEWYKAFAAAKAAAGYKQGGRFNRVSYFQQGGAAPQQDIKAQVTALVQAAMQGDQKATQQVNQILEAAKAGDQQAMQIAQMIQQVVEQMQGQATAAKWGAKLGYIKSLKYAKGGKTCPACEKQVEMKACGGKKAKKRYFGGLI